MKIGKDGNDNSIELKEEIQIIFRKSIDLLISSILNNNNNNKLFYSNCIKV
jgi:hypothetical protein